MTVSQMIPLIGRTFMVSFESIEVECRIVDARSSFGRIRFLVSPTGSGRGSQWVEEARIRVPESQPEPNRLPQAVLDRLMADEREIRRIRGEAY